MLWIHLHHLIYTMLIVCTAVYLSDSSTCSKMPKMLLRLYCSQSWLQWQNTMDWLPYTETSYSSGGWKSAIRTLAGLGLARALFSVCRRPPSCSIFMWQRIWHGQSKLIFLLYMSINVIMRAPPSWPHYLQGGWGGEGGLGFKHRNVKETQRYNMPSIPAFLSHCLLDFTSPIRSFAASLGQQLLLDLVSAF